MGFKTNFWQNLPSKMLSQPKLIILQTPNHNWKITSRKLMFNIVTKQKGWQKYFYSPLKHKEKTDFCSNKILYITKIDDKTEWK